MKISFIITYHDEPEDLLIECLESVFALALPSAGREVIVVDDGSEHFPSSVSIAYANDICYYRQPNQGLSVARNTGLSLASGDYIQFIDADDTLLPTSYQLCLVYLQEHPETDILQFRHTTQKHPFKPTAFSQPVVGTEYLLTSNLRPAAWGYIFRHDILKELRFTPGILHEDEEFTPLLFLRARSICSTDGKPYFYRQRETSITHQTDAEWVDKRFGDFLGVMKRLNMLAEGNGPQAAALRWRLEQLSMNCVYQSLQLCSDFKTAERYVTILSDEGFFPLPRTHGESLFDLFRIMSRTQIGRRVIRLIISLLPNGGKRR